MSNEFVIDRVTTGGGLNPEGARISGGRLGMVKVQNGQYVPIIDSEPRQRLSGTEGCHAKAVWDVRVESDCDVLVIDIIDKYRPDSSRVFSNPEYTIVYKSFDDHSVGSLTVPKYMSNHTTFGFSLIEKPKVTIGNVLKANEIIAHGPSRKSDGNFAYGREVNTAYHGVFGTNEDGATASFSVKDMFKSEIFTETEIFVDSNEALLNLFGTDDYYKPLPSIGEKLSPMGLLAAKRELVKTFRLTNTSKSSYRKVQRPFDKTISNVGGAEVIDITVIKGKKTKLDNLPAGLVTYLDALASNTNIRDRRILELDKKLQMDARRAGNKYQRDPTWHIMVRDAERLVGERIPNKPEPSITRGDAVISGYYIKVITRKINTPQIGHKMTDDQAGKYVICSFKSDEDMATDDWGRVAHFEVNPSGVVNRNNPSQLYNCFVTDACFHTKRQLNEMKAAGADFSTLWSFLCEFYRLISPNSFELVTKYLKPESYQAHLDKVMSHRIDLDDEIGQSHMGNNTVGRLKGTPYYPERRPVRFRTAGGEMVKSVNPIRISNKYVYAMEKIGSSSSACNLPLKQSAGFASKLDSKAKKYAQFSTQASRCYGESEFRDIIAKAGIGVAKDIMNFNSNGIALKEMADQLLSTSGFVHMENAPKFSGRGIGILKHIMACYGMEFEYREEDNGVEQLTEVPK